MSPQIDKIFKLIFSQETFWRAYQIYLFMFSEVFGKLSTELAAFLLGLRRQNLYYHPLTKSNIFEIIQICKLFQIKGTRSIIRCHGTGTARQSPTPSWQTQSPPAPPGLICFTLQPRRSHSRSHNWSPVFSARSQVWCLPPCWQVIS